MSDAEMDGDPVKILEGDTDTDTDSSPRPFGEDVPMGATASKLEKRPEG